MHTYHTHVACWKCKFGGLLQGNPLVQEER